MQDPGDVTIAFLGGGNMARALISGLLRHGAAPASLAVGEPQEATRDALVRDFGVRACADNAAAVHDANVIVLAVKPQEAAGVLRALAPGFASQPPAQSRLLLSVAAGLRAADLARWCDGRIAVVRAMPNRPALIGAGATGLYADAAVTAAQRALAQRVMDATGCVIWVASEAQLDAVTALSGSGPAYFFLLAELMAAAAVREGLDAQVANRLAARTLYGAGQLAAADDADLARLRNEVTSRGGTTFAALEVLRAARFDELVAHAVAAAAARSRELAEQLGSG